MPSDNELENIAIKPRPPVLAEARAKQMTNAILFIVGAAQNHDTKITQILRAGNNI